MEEPIIDNFLYHYPPEVLRLLVNVIPKLCMSKNDLLLFFRGARVKTSILKPYEDLLAKDRNAFKMYPVTRELLAELNEQGDQALSARREIIKRVIEIEDFSICYDNQRDAARGLVYQLREMVDKKDSSTKMRIEKDEEKLKYIREKEAAIQLEQKKKKKLINKVHSDLSSLITDKDPHKRGKALEKVLNELFACYEISIRESFTISGENSEGIVEQIDGVIQFEGTYYLVEMKWWKDPIGKSEINDHIVRMQERGGQVKGLYISFSDYTEPSITACRNALNYGVVMVLAKLEEIFRLLEAEGDLKRWLKTKIEAAMLDKKPFVIIDM